MLCGKNGRLCADFTGKPTASLSSSFEVTSTIPFATIVSDSSGTGLEINFGSAIAPMSKTARHAASAAKRRSRFGFLQGSAICVSTFCKIRARISGVTSSFSITSSYFVKVVRLL